MKDVLRLGGQQSYLKSAVTLSDHPRDKKCGAHNDRYIQLLVRVMWGNGLSWAVMLTILTEPQRTGSKTSHRGKKFEVPDYVVSLLRNLPLVTGFGIRGDVLAIEDTFSLLTGRPVKLSGFVELGSLMLLEGWAMPTCNMPACHALMTGSILNKHVSRADDQWGQKWSQIPDAMQMYAITDLKHGWLTWVIAVGCMLRDLFPDPDAKLFLTPVS